MLYVSLSGFEFIELGPQLGEDFTNTGVVGKHHATYFVLRGNIWTFLGKCHLNRSGSPWNEVCKFSLSDSL